MGIADRLAKIAKSYVHSAGETISEEITDLKKKWESGELASALREKAQALKNSKTDSEEPTDEELENLFKQEWEDIQFQNQGKTRTRTNPVAKRKLKEAYQRLGLSDGASVEDAEKAYKKQMREYHPDRFASSPEKQKAATKIAQMLSEALETIRKGI